MLDAAALVLAIAAAGGLTMALMVLRGKFAPWALSLLHALLGATGLLLLAAALAQGGAAALVAWSLAALAAAALGGFYLASLHLKQRLPKPVLVLGHAGIAVLGFGLLLAVVLGA